MGMLQYLDDPMPLTPATTEERHAALTRVTKLRHRRQALTIGGPAVLAAAAAAVAMFAWIAVAQPGLNSSPVQPLVPTPGTTEQPRPESCSFLVKSQRATCGLEGLDPSGMGRGPGALPAGSWGATLRGAGDEVGFSVTLPAGWRLDEPVGPDAHHLGLRAIDGSLGMVVAVDPMGALCRPSGACRYQRVDGGGFSSWLWAHPSVDGYSNEDVVVAGYDAAQYDLPPLERAPRSPCPPVHRCEGLLASYYPPGASSGSSPPIAGITQGASRILAMDIPYSQAPYGTSSVVFWLWSADPTDDVDAAVAEVQQIIEGMTIQVPEVGESTLTAGDGN